MSALTEADKDQLIERGKEVNQVESQLLRFREGFPPAVISQAAIVGQGIKKLSDQEIDDYISLYNKTDLSVLKFVPASGAATRMFKSLFAFEEEVNKNPDAVNQLLLEQPEVKSFFDGIENFAFHDQLDQLMKDQKSQTIQDAISNGQHGQVLSLLLSQTGLNYGQLPKGLLAFHQYEDHSRTPAAEHLHEGLAYANQSGQVNIHFTVSPEHQDSFQSQVEEAIVKMESNAKFQISYSTQKPSTDTIAATPDFAPFKDQQDQFLFRPAGHGALLENLDALEEDIIFIKNIDNVVPDRLKEETIRYKKALAGVLLSYQQKTFSLLKQIEEEMDVNEEAIQLLDEMGARDIDPSQVSELLNRPIRICGMVKNEGEPGGGPFWVKSESGDTLQIVESAQVDASNAEQMEAFKKGTHFNPVDLVIGVRNYRGEKFDLIQYRDDETGFISEKSHQGRQLLAMELPGLWNGAMANWNTIFVEVPLITFNPVKSVNDLLKPTHH